MSVCLSTALSVHPLTKTVIHLRDLSEPPQSQRLFAPTEPGIYRDVPDHIYHRDRESLSSSGARRLLRVAPAQWLWELHHPRTEVPDYFDLGSAVHTLVLGVGAPIYEVRSENWKTKAAQQERERVRAAGFVPLLSKQCRLVEAMAAAVFDHPPAAALLARGEPELSVYWPDPATKVMLRARPDWTRWTRRGAVLVDLKTSDSADPAQFAEAVAKHGYHLQQPWYQAGFTAHGIATRFVFIVISKQPPHLVSVCELSTAAVARGERRNRVAIGRYSACLDSGNWPGHDEVVHRLDLPARYYRKEHIHGY